MNSKRKILWITYVALFLTTIWLLYGSAVDGTINEIQAKRIQSKMIINYHDQSAAFNDLYYYCNSIERIEELNIYKDKFELHISDSLKPSEGWYEKVDDSNCQNDVCFDYISINAHPDDEEVKDLRFIFPDVLEVESESGVERHRYWHLVYAGKPSDPIAKKLLKYRNITPDQVSELMDQLKNLDCTGISKNDTELIVRYRGHSGKNLSYIRQYQANSLNDSWKPIDKHWYTGNVGLGIFCGNIDW